MAKYYIAGRVEINGVNLSDNAYTFEVHQTKAELSTTNMASAGEERIPGIANDSLVVNFHQDHAAADVDATLFPLRDSGAQFSVKIRVTNAAISPTNPEYQATCRLLEYSPIAGDVGALSTVPITFPVDGVITRATA